MGKARYMYNNLAEAASLAISSVVAGRVSSVAPQKTGSAVLVAQGPYTGQEGRAYTVQIDSVSPGNEIGQATFRWRRDDSASWEASGQATSASLVSLDNGVQIRWNAGAGDDFALYDLWNFLAEQVHSPAALVDGDPNSYWRSDDDVLDGIALDIDLGAAAPVSALIVGYHNFTSAAAVTIKGNQAGFPGVADYQAVVSWSQLHMGLFLDQTLRYWRLELSDPTNPDGHLRIGQAFLGPYFEPSRNHSIQHSLAHFANQRERDAGGNPTGRLLKGRHRIIRLPYPDLSTQDKSGFEGLFEAVYDVSGEEAKPLWICLDADTPGEVIMGNLGESLAFSPAGLPTRYSTEISLTELSRSA